MTAIAPCLGCGRSVSTDNGRFNRHQAVKGVDGDCFMSKQHVPITGRTDADMISRAHLVTDLAMQVQDRDPVVVWNYLTAMPPALVQELLMVALAGMQLEGRTVEDIWEWVCQLPDALETAG